MTYRLETKSKETIVKVEQWKCDFRVDIDIFNYSTMLLSLNEEDAMVGNFVMGFKKIQDLRLEWFGRNSPEKTLEEFLENRLKALAKNYDFTYITD